MARLGAENQAMRLLGYLAVHPGVRINNLEHCWQAVIPHDRGGETVVIQFGLGELLDDLEARDGKQAPLTSGPAGSMPAHRLPALRATLQPPERFARPRPWGRPPIPLGAAPGRCTLKSWRGGEDS